MLPAALKRQYSRACDAGPVPQLTDKASTEVLVEHSRSEQPFNIGSYTKLKRACAVDGKGLVRNKSLIEALYKIQPSGRFHRVQLERCICHVLDSKPSLDDTTLPNTHYTRWAAKQILVIAAHVRRIMCPCDRYVRSAASSA